MILLAESGNLLTKLACESTDCLSYIISLLDILTILYLAYCASFRVTKGVRIYGWIWAGVVIAATIAIIAIHTCLFTLVSALFTALVLMALFGVTFEDIANKKKPAAEGDKKAETPAVICPFAPYGCAMMKQPMPAAAPVQEAPAPVQEEAKAEEVHEEEVVADKADEEPVTLKESLAIAKQTEKASGVINKMTIGYFLNDTFGDEVECNMRTNFTKTGLPLADTHYAVSEKGKKCFAYVYETEAAVVLLLCLTEAYAESIRANGHRIIRSAFPKSKDAWYSIIVDDSYTEDDIHEILTDACNMAK